MSTVNEFGIDFSNPYDVSLENENLQLLDKPDLETFYGFLSSEYYDTTPYLKYDQNSYKNWENARPKAIEYIKNLDQKLQSQFSTEQYKNRKANIEIHKISLQKTFNVFRFMYDLLGSVAVENKFGVDRKKVDQQSEFKRDATVYFDIAKKNLKPAQYRLIFWNKNLDGLVKTYNSQLRNFLKKLEKTTQSEKAGEIISFSKKFKINDLSAFNERIRYITNEAKSTDYPPKYEYDKDEYGDLIKQFQSLQQQVPQQQVPQQQVPQPQVPQPQVPQPEIPLFDLEAFNKEAERLEQETAKQKQEETVQYAGKKRKLDDGYDNELKKIPPEQADYEALKAEKEKGYQAELQKLENEHNAKIQEYEKSFEIKKAALEKQFKAYKEEIDKKQSEALKELEKTVADSNAKRDAIKAEQEKLQSDLVLLQKELKTKGTLDVEQTKRLNDLQAKIDAKALEFQNVETKTKAVLDEVKKLNERLQTTKGQYELDIKQLSVVLGALQISEQTQSKTMQLERELDRTTYRNSMLLERIGDLERKRKELSASLSIEKLGKPSSTIEQDIQKAKAEYLANQKKLEELKSKVEELSGLRKEKQQELTAVQREKKSIDKEIEKTQQLLEKIEQPPPTEKPVVTDEEIEAERKKLETAQRKLELAKEKVAKLSESNREYKDKQKELVALEKEQKNAAKELAKAQKEFDKIKKSLPPIPKLPFVKTEPGVKPETVDIKEIGKKLDDDFARYKGYLKELNEKIDASIRDVSGSIKTMNDTIENLKRNESPEEAAIRKKINDMNGMIGLVRLRSTETLATMYWTMISEHLGVLVPNNPDPRGHFNVGLLDSKASKVDHKFVDSLFADYAPKGIVKAAVLMSAFDSEFRLGLLPSIINCYDHFYDLYRSDNAVMRLDLIDRIKSGNMSSVIAQMVDHPNYRTKTETFRKVELKKVLDDYAVKSDDIQCNKYTLAVADMLGFLGKRERFRDIRFNEVEFAKNKTEPDMHAFATAYNLALFAHLVSFPFRKLTYTWGEYVRKDIENLLKQTIEISSSPYGTVKRVDPERKVVIRPGVTVVKQEDAPSLMEIEPKKELQKGTLCINVFGFLLNAVESGVIDFGKPIRMMGQEKKFDQNVRSDSIINIYNFVMSKFTTFPKAVEDFCSGVFYLNAKREKASAKPKPANLTDNAFRLFCVFFGFVLRQLRIQELNEEQTKDRQLIIQGYSEVERILQLLIEAESYTAGLFPHVIDYVSDTNEIEKALTRLKLSEWKGK